MKYIAQNVVADLVTYWEFEESTANNLLNNSIGSYYHLRLRDSQGALATIAATTAEYFVCGRALDLSTSTGRCAYIPASEGFRFWNEDWTFGLWAAVQTNTVGQPVILAGNIGSSGSAGWQFSLTLDDVSQRLRMTLVDSTLTPHILELTNPLSADMWGSTFDTSGKVFITCTLSRTRNLFYMRCYDATNQYQYAEAPFTQTLNPATPGPDGKSLNNLAFNAGLSSDSVYRTNVSEGLLKLDQAFLINSEMDRLMFEYLYGAGWGVSRVQLSNDAYARHSGVLIDNLAQVEGKFRYVTTQAHGPDKIISANAFPGESWTDIVSLDHGKTYSETTDLADGGWSTVEYLNNRYIALEGSMGASDRLALSDDGITWSYRTVPGADTWVKVACHGTQHVAISYTNVMSSSDGQIWSESSQISTGGLIAVLYATLSSRWLAFESMTPAVYSSTDAVTWQAATAVDVPHTVNGYVYDTAQSPEGIIVTVPYLGRYFSTSLDGGLTWQAVNIHVTGIWNITHDGQQFIATAMGRFLTSTDGLIWETWQIPAYRTMAFTTVDKKLRIALRTAILPQLLLCMQAVSSLRGEYSLRRPTEVSVIAPWEGYTGETNMMQFYQLTFPEDISGYLLIHASMMFLTHSSYHGLTGQSPLEGVYMYTVHEENGVQEPFAQFFFDDAPSPPDPAWLIE